MFNKSLLILVLVLSSCVSSNISSNKAVGFDEKIDKLFIIVKGAESTEPFFIKFVHEFRNNLNEKGIESKSYYISPLSLDSESEINKNLYDYNPNLIMMINQTESQHVSNNNGFGFGSSVYTGGTFDVKLFKPNSEKPLWRASLTASGDFGITTASKKSAQKLIDKLIEDKLVN